MPISELRIKELAQACGFELAGIAAAAPSADYPRFAEWRREGRAGEMTYLTDRRGDLRNDPRALLPEAQSIVSVGKLYNTAQPNSIGEAAYERGRISRYAWGADYHEALRKGLEDLRARIQAEYAEPFASRICVDTAPLLERTYARAAGLGWIGKNTCLINQQQGSWFFLGELLLSIPLAPDAPPPDRCGTCTRCIEACPTDAILPDGQGGWTLDARLCISYLTIEKRGPIAAELAGRMTNHIFGCDICQDVCPWNRQSPVTTAAEFDPRESAPPLEELSQLTADGFRTRFRQSPVWRAKYSGFLRNVAIAMGNSRQTALREPLEKLTRHDDAIVAATACQALERLGHP